MEDRLLVGKLKKGDSRALGRIYAKYKNHMLALALALVPDRETGEDIVHDVFVAFARIARSLKLRRSLKSYLLTSVVNHTRNLLKAKSQENLPLDEEMAICAESQAPDHVTISREEAHHLITALDQIPHLQREVIVLHLQAGMKFRTIAAALGVSINTIQSRYRYGLAKLRSILTHIQQNENNEVFK